MIVRTLFTIVRVLGRTVTDNILNLCAALLKGVVVTSQTIVLHDDIIVQIPIVSTYQL